MAKSKFDWEMFLINFGFITVVLLVVSLAAWMIHRVENRKYDSAELPQVLIGNYRPGDIKEMKDGDTLYFKKHVMKVNNEGRCWITTYNCHWR